jgi:hypothetical protein
MKKVWYMKNKNVLMILAMLGMVTTFSFLCAGEGKGGAFVAYWGPVSDPNLPNMSPEDLVTYMEERVSASDTTYIYDVSAAVSKLFTNFSQVSYPTDEGAEVMWSYLLNIPVLFMNDQCMVGKVLPGAPGTRRLVIVVTLAGLFGNPDWLEGSGTFFEDIVDAAKQLAEKEGFIPDPLPPIIGIEGQVLNWEKAEDSSFDGGGGD